VTDYTVQPGDCLSSIAAAHGFADWRTLYDNDSNADFRKLRPDPNVINPGDVLKIPDVDPVAHQVQTGKAYTFVVKRPRTVLRLALEVNEATNYELTCGDQTFSGSVSDASPFEHPIPVGATEAQLSIWPASAASPAGKDAPGARTTWSLQVGHLNPIEEPSGVLGRLMNLGYYDGDLNQADEAARTGAVRRFQLASKLDATGQLDDSTRSALLKRHDG
jgi:LysM repeat protein